MGVCIYKYAVCICTCLCIPPVDGWGWGVAGLHRPHGRDLAWKAITSVWNPNPLEHLII